RQAGADFWYDRNRARPIDEGGHRYRRGVEQAVADAGAQPLARGDPAASSTSAGRCPAVEAALHDPGQHATADFCAVRVETERAARQLSPLSDQCTAQGFRPAGNADPADAAQG